MSASLLPHPSWVANWPDDRDGVARALAVAAAFPELTGSFRISLAGELTGVSADLAGSLAANGISESDLPDVTIVAATPGDSGLPHVDGLPGALAAGCEYSRRASVPAFPPGDVGYRDVWTAAGRALAENEEATATLITDSLEGSEVVASPCRVTVVSGCPLTRRNARRHSFAAVPRPPSAKHLPSASFLVFDARRPDDLALAGASDGETIVVNGDRIPDLAFVSLGLIRETAA